MSVVDSGSTDGTCEIASSFGANVVSLDCPFDYSSARNFGAGTASYDMIFQLDDDEVVHPRSVERIQRVLSAGQRAGKKQYLISQLQVYGGKVSCERTQIQQWLYNGGNSQFVGRCGNG